MELLERSQLLGGFEPSQRALNGIDRQDAEAVGLIKLDLLGLGMLGVFERCREEVLKAQGRWLELTDLPNDPGVWREIRHGDTMGLFQIESPAQTRITVDGLRQVILDQVGS